MKIFKIINPEKALLSEVKKYRLRKAARAVVVDMKKRITLLDVTKNGYYKLPGGGLEGNENPTKALARECKEEIGCQVEIIDELGIVVEYRKMFKLKQVSYCYLARVKGKKGKPHFTPKESNEGFKVKWVPSSTVIATFKKGKAQNKEGRLYIAPRDLAILKDALHHAYFREKDKVT